MIGYYVGKGADSMDQPRGERLDPAVAGPDLLSAWARVHATVQAAERGGSALPVARSPEQLGTLLPARGNPMWAGWLGAQLVGAAAAHAGPQPGAGFVRLSVDAEHRRRGVGRALVAVVGADQLAAGVETTYAMVRVDTDGERFASALGAVVADALVVDALDAHTADIGALERLAHPAADDAYTLRTWQGKAPEEMVGSYAALKQEITDAPNSLPPATPPWDRSLVRERERTYLQRGQPLWVCAAVDTTGNVVAFTEIGVPDRQQRSSAATEASQEDTVVLVDHRRQGLATRVKARLIGQLLTERPDVVRITSTTALVNEPMRAVNEQLGFYAGFRRNLVRLPTENLL